LGLFSKKEPVLVKLPSGDRLVCLQCKGERFLTRRFLLTADWTAFLDIEWASRRAHCFVCSACGFVHWFSWGNAELRKIQE
jgi:hypothetical protein